MSNTNEKREIIIRDVTTDDFVFVMDLNDINVEVLSPMNTSKFLYFTEVSEMFQVMEVDGRPAAFIIALREGIDDYSSENYRWFCGHYEKFLYVDRIVVDEEYRRLGLGRDAYEHVFDRARETGVPMVTAEGDIIPYNEPSLKFHSEMGFEEVGQQVIRGGKIKVSLQVKKL